MVWAPSAYRDKLMWWLHQCGSTLYDLLSLAYAHTEHNINNIFFLFLQVQGLIYTQEEVKKSLLSQLYFILYTEELLTGIRLCLQDREALLGKFVDQFVTVFSHVYLVQPVILIIADIKLWIRGVLWYQS